MGNFLDYLYGPNVITKSLKDERGRHNSPRRSYDYRSRSRSYGMAGFDDRGREHRQRNEGRPSLEGEKDKEMDSSLSLQEKQSC